MARSAASTREIAARSPALSTFPPRTAVDCAVTVRSIRSVRGLRYATPLRSVVVSFKVVTAPQTGRWRWRTARDNQRQPNMSMSTRTPAPQIEGLGLLDHDFPSGGSAFDRGDGHASVITCRCGDQITRDLPVL